MLELFDVSLPDGPLPVSGKPARLMFSIEHGFDATIITLVDEGEGSGRNATPPGEDVVIAAFEECVTLTQPDPRTGEPVQITLTSGQLRDLAAALDLPEGVYRRVRDET